MNVQLILILGKFLRQYISALIPFVFQEEPLSTEEWNALAEYRITPSFELAQCFGCLYGIKLLVTIIYIYLIWSFKKN